MAVTGRVFSYCRCSTTAQDRDGADSFSRQEAQARAWCERQGVDLDPMDLSDVGVSAYRGKNLAGGGVLDQFLAMARSGQLGDGPTLLVEDMDRFSRASPITVFPKLLQDVVEAGVTLVVLRDGLTINRSTLENDIGTWYRLLAGISAAHDFSRKLSERVLSAKQKERDDIARGVKRRTGVTPFWVRWDDAAGDFVLIEDQAALVREVFDLAIDQGYGCGRIARIFREQGRRTTAGSSYQTSTIYKIVTNLAVTGLYQPSRMADVVVVEAGRKVTRTRSVPHGDPIPRYPAVIDDERFTLAQEKLKSRSRQGGPRTMFRSPLQGVIRCLKCGQLMAYSPAIRDGVLYEYIRCGHGAKSRVKDQLCSRTTNYQSVLAAVLTGLGQTTWESFFSDVDSEAELQRELARLKELEAGLQAMKVQRQNMVTRVQEAAAAGAELPLLQTLQDGVTLKDADIADREASLSRTTARIAELRHHPLAGAWPALREQIAELLKVFGRGQDTEIDRARLNGLLVSHGIEIFLDQANSAVAFVVNGRSQFHFFDPDQAVVQLWHGIVQNADSPSELSLRKQLLQDANAVPLNVGPAPGPDTPLAEREAWIEAARAALQAATAADGAIARLADHVEQIGVLYEDDLVTQAKQIRKDVCANRMKNRTL